MRRGDKGEFWWELRPCDYYDALESDKIIYPDIAKGPRFFLASGDVYVTNTAYFLGSGDLYLLGILNSRLSWFAISSISIPFGTRAGEFRYRLFYQYVEKIPIRSVDFAEPGNGVRREDMVKLVERMLSLHGQMTTAKTATDSTMIQRQIDATDRQIDRLVYELYGLTEEEIRIVEDVTR
ncbi:MAG: hypothetical protein M3346_03280 [Actinomycetota bacterium]|nr:hypothetical protein [Actinomycetota bacterium]